MSNYGCFVRPKQANEAFDVTCTRKLHVSPLGEETLNLGIGIFCVNQAFNIPYLLYFQIVIKNFNAELCWHVVFMQIIFHVSANVYKAGKMLVEPKLMLEGIH